jgi:UDP-glucose 4-epimerase
VAILVGGAGYIGSHTIVERRPGDVAVCYANPSKAEKELNWAATRRIEEMCADAWRWQANNRTGYKEGNQILLE